MRIFILLILLVSVVSQAGIPEEISIEQADELGFKIQVDEEHQGCFPIYITIPSVHPTYSQLTKANIGAFLTLKDGSKLEAQLTVAPLDNFAAKKSSAYFCFKPEVGDLTISVSYSEDWEEICKEAEKNSTPCNRTTTCYPNWRINGVSQHVQKLITKLSN